MSPDKMRMAIAKECGWREAFPPNGKPHELTKRGGILLPYHWVQEGTNRREIDIPDYPNDLNACHDMEKTLIFSERQKYYGHLQQIMSRELHGNVKVHFRECIRATALQRCEAFCRTKGIYHD